MTAPMAQPTATNGGAAVLPQHVTGNSQKINHQHNNVADLPTTSTVLRRVLPLAGFSMGFAIVMTTLILYMDNTAMRHYQFRVNMSQDYELLGVAQDNMQLITYIREVHVHPAMEPPHHHGHNGLRITPPIDMSAADHPPAVTRYVQQLLHNRTGGVFLEAGAYSDGKSSKTAWLESQWKWSGLLVQADTRHYFNLRRHNRHNSKAVHACLSPTTYPKEVTFHQENDVRINRLLVDDPDWTRIKCFPLYSLMLAVNATQLDLLCLQEATNTEIQILETIPFDRVRIKVMVIDITDDDLTDLVKVYLAKKRYRFMKQLDRSFVFMLHDVYLKESA